MPGEGSPERDHVPSAEPLLKWDAHTLQERYRLLAENVADIIFTLDLELRFTYASPSVERILGYSPEEAVGLTLERLLTPRSLELAMRAWQEEQAQEFSGPPRRTRTLELEEMRKDGTTLWVEVVLSPMRDAEGNLTGILGVSRDVTERKKAEEALRESEEKYHGLLDNLSDVVVELDSEGVFRYLSPQVEDVFGFRPGEMEGRSFAEFIHPDWHDGALEGIRRVLEEQPVHDFEFKCLHKDGRYRDASISARRVFKEGKATLVGVIEDISGRKRADEALRASEEKYRDLVENVNDVIYSCDVNGSLTYASPSAERILGYRPEDIIGRPFTAIVHPDDLERIKEEFVRRLNGVLEPAEYRLLDKAGRPHWVRTSSRVVRTGGSITGLTGTMTDITDRMTAEAALRDKEEKYRLIVDNMADTVWIMDMDLHTVFATPSVERNRGFTKEELATMPFESQLAQSSVERVRGLFRDGTAQRLLNGELRELTMELEFRLKGGGTTWAECNLSVIRNENGEPKGIVGAARNIQDRKVAEDALRASEEKFRRLFETSPEGVVMLDLDGVVTDMNEAAHRFRDIPRERIIGHRFEDFASVPEEELPRYMEMFGKLAAGEHFEPLEVRLRGEGGEQWVEVFPVLLEKNGAAYAVQVILRDITERKRAHLEMLARLMKYELGEGNIYLVKESTPLVSVDSFRDLLMAGYRGAVLSRTPSGELHIGDGGKFEHRWLSEKGGPGSLRPRLEDIERWLDGLPRGMALLIDRLDYIISKNGFSGTLHFIHRLRELAYIMGHVVVLSLDPATVEGRFLRALEKETLAVEPRSRPTVTADQQDMLGYIHRQSLLGARPTLTELGRALKLSKPTARKKVRDLVRRGFLALSPRGRTKLLELTDLGRRVFQT